MENYYLMGLLIGVTAFFLYTANIFLMQYGHKDNVFLPIFGIVVIVVIFGIFLTFLVIEYPNKRKRVD